MPLRKITTLFAVLAATALSVIAIGDTPWKTTQVALGKFSFEMPGKPKLVQRNDPTPVNAYVLATGDGVMIVGHSEAMPFNVNASGAKKIFDDFEKGLAGSAKLQAAGRRETQHQGRPARLLLYQGPEGEFWRVLAVVNGDRIVFQMFIGEKEKLASPSVAKFFNSLKLL